MPVYSLRPLMIVNERALSTYDPMLSVTRKVMVVVPTELVVPDIAPVLVFNPKPLGSEEAEDGEIDHVYGATPPVADKEALYATPAVP